MNGHYKYKVKAMTNEGETSPFSPTLTYEPMRGFCGDGKIDKGKFKCLFRIYFLLKQ